MCGIVGIVSGSGSAAPRLLQSLKRLEYRGYDSAGIATVSSGAIVRRRASGKLNNLAERLESEPLSGPIGIAHTRWATHGKPSEANAHPHATEEVAVVHNGIIENFRELADDLLRDGYARKSETDTEVLALYMSRELRAGVSPEDAARKLLACLSGSFALAFIFRDYPYAIAARRGAPLAIGYGAEEMYFGSDGLALAPLTSDLAYLENGDWAVIKAGGAVIRDANACIVERERILMDATARDIDKGPFRHFMAKEIHEQPDAIRKTLTHYADFESRRLALRERLPIRFESVRRLTIVACGTAKYAGDIGKHWFEEYARLPADVDVASEFRYREPVLDPAGLALPISQSGETADTLAALEYCKASGQPVASILNTMESTIGRASDIRFPTLCGPEIGVASTKALSAQLTVLAALAVIAGRERGVLKEADERRLTEALLGLPAAVEAALLLEDRIVRIARDLSKAKSALFLGRGPFHPVALEGALKLKEVSYIHAEGYPAGELKHGPIALVDPDLPVIVIAPTDRRADKTFSNMEEVAARGGKILLITDAAGAVRAEGLAAETLVLPAVDPFVAPIVSLVPLQLLAYHAALSKGTDVDQPRNLAKSVTVE